MTPEDYIKELKKVHAALSLLPPKEQAILKRFTAKAKALKEQLEATMQELISASSLLAAVVHEHGEAIPGTAVRILELPKDSFTKMPLTAQLTSIETDEAIVLRYGDAPEETSEETGVQEPYTPPAADAKRKPN